MPNWCQNWLMVECNDDDPAAVKQLADFVELSKNEETALSLAATVPTDDPDRDWDTKWDVVATVVFADDSLVEYIFSSAWCPPVLWLKAVSAKYPKLTFELRYDERGCRFAGMALAEEGTMHYLTMDYGIVHERVYSEIKARRQQHDTPPTGSGRRRRRKKPEPVNDLWSLV
jgi:hypothetical protein